MIHKITANKKIKKSYLDFAVEVAQRSAKEITTVYINYQGEYVIRGKDVSVKFFAKHLKVGEYNHNAAPLDVVRDMKNAEKGIYHFKVRMQTTNPKI